jgi:hypothetical protein
LPCADPISSSIYDGAPATGGKETEMAVYEGRWHGKGRYFGLHYDLHAGAEDTELGLRATPEWLVPMLRMMGCQFVQTDCKGHPGYTSWYSKTPGASVSPGVKRDALKGWREATRRLGLPLHCHYSGIWDKAAGAKHPKWCIVGKDGKPVGGSRWERAKLPTNERMCPRGPYVDKLMIPQMIELIDRYGVDGFWVDGEIWAVEPCYCTRCRRAFRDATGIAKPPTESDDPNWLAWLDFTRRSFEDYVTHYCNAVRAHKPSVLVCSNYVQTFRDPGEPAVPTDWISGDNSPLWGLDSGRCQARFISTRGKPWDLMIWAFYSPGDVSGRRAPSTFKPSQMIQQEAAVTLSLGGMVQVYDSSGGLRDGRLIEWRMKRLREVGRFVKARRALCQGSEGIPQAVVLHSEHHIRSQRAKDLWDVDTAPVLGAMCSLLENHYGVDIMDEWALGPRLGDFPLVVAPEQDNMSDAMVDALRNYVRDGGRLLVSGAAAFERFGGRFLGVSGGTVEKDVRYHVAAADGSVPVFSEQWRLVRPTKARALGRLGTTPLLDQRLLACPPATLSKVGKGVVAYVPFSVFRFFDAHRYPLVRTFVGQLARALAGRQAIHVEGPACVDVVLRRKGGKSIIHLINRASGIPNSPNAAAVDEIPAVGPVRVEMRVAQRPRKAGLAFGDGAFEWKYVAGRRGGKVIATVAQVHIHCAVVIEAAPLMSA